MKDYESADFFRDEGLIEDPYPYFDALRAQCPVRRENHHDVVMVTGYEEAVQIYNDTDTFSACNSVTGPFPGFPVPLEGDDVSELIEQHRDELPMSDQLPTLDPPVHTDHRALLMRLITPKRLKENEAAMWHLADGLLDDFLTGGEGEFINGFAGPFTMLVIADLLGVPEEDRAEVAAELRHGPPAGAAMGSTSEGTMAHSPLEHLYDRVARYIEDRRRAPREDVLSGLAAATFPDGRLPDVADVVRVAANLFAAGQETTVRLLGTALKLIAERPELQRELRAERDRIPAFVEEVLRIESPVKGDFRLSKVPTTVGGVDIPAGTTVMVLNGAANRDPRQFACPADFDIGRSNVRRHLAFGRGVHTCPGAPLARAEARVAIERLLDRTTDIRLAEEKHGPEGARRYRYVPTFMLRGLTRLFLEFTLADAPAAEEVAR
ncbi:cytochrome P450 [Streptomyces sp. PSKA54]|uniref:Cytochrome P450 n=1 Tax=Streptomyces himalayensis subsp. aureolus TaxID=2758039 RepID=A0A7W2D2R7_9ACTN|nr:cytochrome P450 [Streptomyces himalayensis]MBA4863576.1 cytochrome P450 [Streptomyces himalayensis subsp. aureolus]